MSSTILLLNVEFDWEDASGEEHCRRLLRVVVVVVVAGSKESALMSRLDKDGEGDVVVFR